MPAAFALRSNCSDFGVARPKSRSGGIKFDPIVRTGGDNGVPVVVSYPDSPVAKALRVIAEDLAAKISVAAMNQGNFIPINLIG